MSHGVISTAPAHIRTRYMRGGCWALAAALSRKTGLDLWGIRDDRGDLHHVFVADPDRDLAIDIRGGMSMDRVADGCIATALGRATQEDMFRHIGTLDPGDMREARKIIKMHLKNLPETKPGNITPEENGPEPC